MIIYVPVHNGLARSRRWRGLERWLPHHGNIRAELVENVTFDLIVLRRSLARPFSICSKTLSFVLRAFDFFDTLFIFMFYSVIHCLQSYIGLQTHASDVSGQDRAGYLVIIIIIILLLSIFMTRFKYVVFVTSLKMYRISTMHPTYS
jgi:hypothetical protein